ncbi:MAG TPA: nucleotidyl transferase AbiEii/AbiGii toxin family protein [Ignavibacteria bacterium]|nr:nucleotidyl transferase AbiEii/AbiGii toxin family protein [Ignavibacteria bacterium]
MIPRPFIARWKNQVPWQTIDQVEQDLVITRTLVEIFSNNFLKENLAFRGGTALHKLYLHPAPRYSEDIDLVQIHEGPIKPILQQIDKVITFFEGKRVVKQKANNNSIIYRFTSEHTEIRLRLKIEINCREHFNVLGWVKFPFKINNKWFSGNTEITTFNINELLGTKLRALYQRKKGRDLFDLHYASLHANLNYDEIIHCYKEYIKHSVNNPPTKKQFLQNIEAKRTDQDFIGDLEGLLRTEIKYNQDEAFTWLKKNIVEKM